MRGPPNRLYRFGVNRPAPSVSPRGPFPADGNGSSGSPRRRVAFLVAWAMVPSLVGAPARAAAIRNCRLVATETLLHHGLHSVPRPAMPPIPWQPVRWRCVVGAQHRNATAACELRARATRLKLVRQVTGGCCRSFLRGGRANASLPEHPLGTATGNRWARQGHLRSESPSCGRRAGQRHYLVA